MRNTSMPSPAPRPFGRRFLVPWVAGLLGIASLLLQELPASMLQQAPHLRELSTPALRLLLLLNPLILMTLMAVAGALLAHRVALRSALAGDAGAQLDPGRATWAGALLAATVLLVDAALSKLLGDGWQPMRDLAAATPGVRSLMVGLLYGGLAEEVIMRWGLMTLVAWLAMRAWRKRLAAGAPPPAAAMWIAIGVAAAMFAAAHLPALAQSVELTGPILLRTLGLNLLAGLVYGWLFWRRSLECAMLAHGLTHVGLAVGRMAA